MTAPLLRREFLFRALASLGAFSLPSCVSSAPREPARDDDAGPLDDDASLTDSEVPEPSEDAAPPSLADAEAEADSGAPRDAGELDAQVDAQLPDATATGVDVMVAALGFFQSELGAAREVGQRYLAVSSQPVERSAVLAMTSRTVTLIVSSPDEASALVALASAVALDFVSPDRVVDIEGWILSKTEADLCALCVVAP